MDLPPIGLGTWELRGSQCTRIVENALDLGYKHIDTAHFYENHEAIAQALKGHDRHSLYITSKLAIDEEVDLSSIEDSVYRACEKALKELKTDYLDLYLIHFPDQNFPLETIFVAMQNLVHQGKIHKAGVSNFTIHHLEDLRKAHLIPFANQVEFHPHLNQQALLDECNKHNIRLISFRSFGKGKLLEEPLFNQIGAQYNKTGAQVILRWLFQKGIASIPKGSSTEHLKENFAIFDFSLTEEEMNKLDKLNKNRRYCLADSPEYNY